MNKDEVLKLAKEHGFEPTALNAEATLIVAFDHFLAFANACEKIGMEKAEKICEAEKVDYSATRDLGDLAYNTAIEHVITAIRKTMK